MIPVLQSLVNAGGLLRICQLCLAILVPISACAEDMKALKWREECKLSGGQIILVDQAEEYRTKEEALRVGALFNNYHIKATFPPPIATTVVWEGHLKPIAIDLAKDSRIYLVTITQTTQAAREYSPEDGRHVAFRYAGGNHWERVAIENIPREIRTNLLININAVFLKQEYPANKVVDLSLKNKVDSDPRIEKSYRNWPTN